MKNTVNNLINYSLRYINEKIAFYFALLILLPNIHAYPETFRVNSLKGYNELEERLKPGDSIIWKNGIYPDIIWIIRQNGLNILPETPGEVIFTGKSVTEISADDVNFSGFQYLNGTTTGDVVKISGSNNKISGVNISGYQSHYYFHITAMGKHNIVEYSNFENKPPAAPGKEGNSIFQVAVDSVSPGYNVIRNCSFKNHQAPPNSGGDYGMEALRIGYSFQAKFISRTIVEYCFFTRCNGDGEIISNKARENIIRYNTFTDNGESHLTLRHGSDNVVYGNFFINGAGIRIKEGQNQMVYNNYFNTESFFSIRLENYRVDPLKNIVIVYNTFIESGPVRLGGKGEYQPEDVKIYSNLFINPTGRMIDDPTGKEQFVDNGYQSPEREVQTGFYPVQSKIEFNTDGYYQPLNKILSDKPRKSNLQVIDIPELNDDPEILLDISGNRRSGKSRSAGCFEPGKRSKPVNTIANKQNTGPDYLSDVSVSRSQKEMPGSWSSSYIKVSEGKILAVPDARGNIIPDFSRVGYHKGLNEIPEVNVVKTISAPASGDSRELIQNAIDEVAKLAADSKGIRGAILLRKGIYRISGTVKINTGGIVLRGEGDDESGTVLVAAGTEKRTLLLIAGKAPAREVQGTRTKIMDEYVPTGALSFTIEKPESFKTGDEIAILRPGTEKWIHDLKMDQIEEREGTKQWAAKDYDLKFEREITRIEGNRIWVDQPVVMAMESVYGGGLVYRITDDRISENGVENILFKSEYTSETDENHGWYAIEIDHCEHGWVRNVTSKYFGNGCVAMRKGSKYITVDSSKCLEAKSLITGGRRYSFSIDGQMCLVMNCEATEGRHDFVTGSRVAGPNVFFNCKATGTHADIGPHHRWSTGTLYDNITTDGEINVQDRGNWGSGHGWSGANQVLWNCKVKEACVQNPWVSAKNWCIGLTGGKSSGRLKERPDGEWEGLNIPGLTPASLYTAQKGRQ